MCKILLLDITYKILIMLFHQFLQLIHILSVQCTVDIFFIDWERPQVHGLTTKLTSPKSNERSTGEVSAALNTKKDKINGEKNLDSPAVSIWRTYFVAKEWCEIQCLRRVQLGFHLMAVLFFLKGIGFENFAHADPLTNFSSENVHINVPYSFICRFSVGSCTYIILATVQINSKNLLTFAQLVISVSLLCQQGSLVTIFMAILPMVEQMLT
ncbi:meckelin-like isoform X2 [Centruroides sculpturatus]|uniref:meckelin-like isoform X2 n=1 Tax=Centruroides sculpturatus TaxID=218467 RepID=UPI000C6DED48|nr:meckelin-like isoform X2 [Centruroides sculpturatus]